MGARGIYTVQNGDSLSAIAAFFYRDGFRWPDIFKATSYLVSHPDLIYPMQILIIPHRELRSTTLSSLTTTSGSQTDGIVASRGTRMFGNT